MVHWLLALVVAGAGWAARGMYRQGFRWTYGGEEGVAFVVPPAGTGTGPTTIVQQFYQQTGPNNQQHIWVKQDGVAGINAGSSGMCTFKTSCARPWLTLPQDLRTQSRLRLE